MHISFEITGNRSGGKITLDDPKKKDLFYGVGFYETPWLHPWMDAPRIYALLVVPRKRKQGGLGEKQRECLRAHMDEAKALAKQHILSLGFVEIEIYNKASKKYEPQWVRKEDLEKALSIQRTYKQEGILV